MLKRVAHPGEILRDELAEMGVSLAAFALQIDVPSNHIGQIIAGKRSVTNDTAQRFRRWFGTGPQFWLNAQRQVTLAADAEYEVGKSE